MIVYLYSLQLWNTVSRRRKTAPRRIHGVHRTLLPRCELLPVRLIPGGYSIASFCWVGTPVRICGRTPLKPTARWPVRY